MPAPTAATVEPLGDSCLVLRFGTEAGVDRSALVRSAAARLAASPPVGVLDLLPTFTTLALFFDPACTDADTLAADALERLAGGGSIEPTPPRVIEIPVVYGGDAGPDLAAVAAAAGLDADTVVRLHAGATHVVGMIGFAPGFPYLLGLPAPLRLPRRATPRTRVPAGSVAIAEAQSGIYPREGPGGWHLIGRTALSLFDPHRAPPALLGAGDRVRFVPIDAAARPAHEAATATDSPPNARGDDPRTAIDVRAPGIRTTVEDAGRSGWRAAGVPVGGAADAEAIRTANLLVGNPDGAAAIEFAFQGPSIVFTTGAWIALAGATFMASVSPAGGDPVPVPPRRPVWIPAGASVVVGLPIAGSGRPGPEGIRGCLAIAGGLDVPAVLGSRSTCLRGSFGGHRGRPLARGDRLAVGLGSLPPPAAPGRVVVSRRSVADHAAAACASTDGSVGLRVVPGPEWERFPTAAREELLAAAFTVSRDSDRTGLRLEGPALAGGPRGILSEALVPGTVQVPPDGAPIVVGVDAPVSGGYARIAVVAAVDLPRLGQLRPGERVRFTRIELASARRLAGTRAGERAKRRLGWECGG